MQLQPERQPGHFGFNRILSHDEQCFAGKQFVISNLEFKHSFYLTPVSCVSGAKDLTMCGTRNSMWSLERSPWIRKSSALLTRTVRLSLLAGFILVGLEPCGAPAATNTVTSLTDSGPGSLRDTIANSATGNTINFAVTGTITLLSGELVMAKDIAIIGPGNSALAINGHNSSRIFNIYPSATVLITDLTISGGKARNGANGSFNGTAATSGEPGEPGGAISTGGSLVLRNCLISGNRAGNGGNGVSFPFPQMGSPTPGGAGGAAGAIYNTGDLTLSNCVILGNTSGDGGTSGSTTWSPGSGPGGDGGGIYNLGTISLEDTVVTQNRTGAGSYLPIGGTGPGGGSGGGIWNGGYFNARKCIFSNNTTGNGGGGGAGKPIGGGGGMGGSGGAICGTNAIQLGFCTVSNNTCGSGGNGGGSANSAGGYGGSGGSGGGIYAAGSLVLVSSTIFDNRAGSGGGGGNSSFAGGTGGTGGYGGGVWCGGGTLAATNCTIGRNSWGWGGGAGQGGMFEGSGGSGGSGGGVYLGGGTNMILVACTIVSNAPGLGTTGGPGVDLSGVGGGVAGGHGKFMNTIVAANEGRDRDISGDHISLGHNLVGTTNGSTGFTSIGDRVGTTNAPLSPNLLPLAANGGPTLTMALNHDSPAIDSGAAAGIPAEDQRGIARPQGRGVDIGAYEFQFTTPQIMDSSAQPGSGFWLQSCGLPNGTYALEASTNLLDWGCLTNSTADSSGVLEFIDATADDEGIRFYRLKLVNP